MNRVILWYDTIGVGNCSYKDVTFTKPSVTELSDFEIQSTSANLDSSKINLYVIELHNVKTHHDIFSLIPPHTKELFNNGLSILIYYPKEGHELEDWFKNIYDSLQNNNLLDKKVYFLFGDLDFEEHYEKFCKKEGVEHDFLKPLSIDFFRNYYFQKASKVNTVHNVKKTKDFLFYNGKMRPHRLYSVAKMHELNLLENSYTSLTGTTHTGESYTINECLDVLEKMNNRHPLKKELWGTVCDANIKKFAENFQPMVLDIEPSNFDKGMMAKTYSSHYLDSYFSIVSESSMTIRFITEKTYKPIYNLHPFIIIGPARFLELLKDKGYVTFPDFFDESYDKEECHVTRINMVIKEVKKFVKLSSQKKEKLYYNSIDKLYHNRDNFIKNQNRFNDLLQIVEAL